MKSALLSVMTGSPRRLAKAEISSSRPSLAPTSSACTATPSVGLELKPFASRSRGMASDFSPASGCCSTLFVPAACARRSPPRPRARISRSWKSTSDALASSRGTCVQSSSPRPALASWRGTSRTSPPLSMRPWQKNDSGAPPRAGEQLPAAGSFTARRKSVLCAAVPAFPRRAGAELG